MGKRTREVKGVEPKAASAVADVASWRDMKDAPYNPRRIEKDALNALKRSLIIFGDISGAVYNRRTGHIVCGHQRRKALESLDIGAIAWGDVYECQLGDGDTHPHFTSRERSGHVSLPGGARIGIRSVEWSPAFEKAANVAANNPHIAGTFTDGIHALLDEIKGEMPALAPALRLDQLSIDGSLADAKTDEPVDEFKDKLGMTAEFDRDGIVFTGDEEYGFPILRSDMLGDRVCRTTFADGKELAPPEETLYLYNVNMNRWPATGIGVVGFYIEDERFDTVWTRPFDAVKSMVERGITQVLSPDFSIWVGRPPVVQMHAAFRSRWCARFWQEKGLRVIPSLNWSEPKTLKWAFLGIPKNVPVVYVQCRTLSAQKESQARFIAGLTAGIKAIEPQRVCIYGAENRELLERNLPRSMDYTWIPSWTVLRPAFRKRQGKTALDKAEKVGA